MKKAIWAVAISVVFFAAAMGFPGVCPADDCDFAKRLAGDAEKIFEKDKNKGLGLFYEARKACPENPAYEYNLGIALYRHGHPKEASKHLALAVEKNKDDPLWLNNLAGTLLEIGNPRDAKKFAQEAIRLKDDYLAAYDTLARANLALDRPDEALQTIESAKRKGPEDPRIAASHAEILDVVVKNCLLEIDRGDLDGGLAGLKKLGPHPEVSRVLVLALLGKGRYESAFQEAVVARESFPKDDGISAAYDETLEKSLKYFLGGIERGDLKAGLAGLKTMDSDPRAARAHILALSGAGENDLALKEAAIAKKRFPGDKKIADAFDQAAQRAVALLWDEFHAGNGFDAYNEAKYLMASYRDYPPFEKAFDELYRAYVDNAAPPPLLERTSETGSVAVAENEDVDTILARIAGNPRTNDKLRGDPTDVEKNIPRGIASPPFSVAVVIGNQRYARMNRGLADVEYAERDATVVKQYLEKTKGFDPDDMIFRKNVTSGDFNTIFGKSADGRGKLHSYIRDETKEIFIYYSGHGLPHPKGETSYLVPVDAEADLIHNNGYDLELLYAIVGKLNVPKKTVVIDSCYSGDSEAGFLFKNTSSGVVRTRNHVKEVSDAVVFHSTAQGQTATWYPEKRHSMFTYFFLKGLGGAADENGDKKITAREMQDFVRPEVKFWARKKSDRDQTPRLVGDPNSVLVRLK